MSRKCELTGKAVLTGNNVSHSNRKNRRRFLPNLHSLTLLSDVLGKIRMRISSNALRSIDNHGGLDNFLISQNDSSLSTKAISFKKKIKDALCSKAGKDKVA